MTSTTVINRFWVAKAEDTESALCELKDQLNSLERFPSIITLVSAGEVKPLLEPLVKEFCEWLGGKTKLQFISAACVSIHGALLDFYHSGRKTGLIISLELDKSIQQACLDSLGIGIKPEQDGLDVVCGVGFVELSRQQSADGIIVQDCQIISQPSGLSGITKLIMRLADYLNQREDDVIPVSFDINSLWGKKLFKGLHHKLEASSQKRHWLPSLEVDGKHYLSLKPLYELYKYQEKFKKNRLLIFTLGGGGRVGWLLLSKKNGVGHDFPAASCENHSLSDDLSEYKKALELERSNSEAFYQKIRTILKYPRSRNRGVHNHYFKWEMN